jgi:cobalamin biosynthesis Mg chelatase CobN
MGAHMKTTVEISTPLLNEAKAVATRENTTLRALVEEGLRESVARRKRRTRRFRLRDGSFRGKGVQEGIDLSDWEQIRALAYEGRGG